MSAYRKLKEINYAQKKASKTIVTEKDIIISNKSGFGDKIGSTTNLTTSQLSLMASFDKNSKEYKELEYRVITGQNYQQNAIDRVVALHSNMQ